MMTEKPALPRPLLDNLQNLSLSQFSGRLDIQASSPHPWQCFFRLGRLVYVSAGPNAQRRWRLHLLQVCPMLDWQSFQKDFQAQSTDALWEYQTLCTMVKQGYLTGESAVEFVREVMAEVLFDAACSPELSFAAHSQERLDAQFTLFNIDTVLENLRLRLAEWQTHGFSTWPPLYYAPLLTKNALVHLPKPLLELLNGKQTFREVATSARMDIHELLKVLMPFIHQGAIDAIALEDTRNPIANLVQTTSEQAPLIVCIDDSPTICQIVERIVTKAGYRFLAIQDPLEAFEMISKAQPALVLLDLVMPNMMGYELCAQLRKRDRCKDLPIVILTSNDNLVERVRAKMAGATGFHGKPIESPSYILTLIDKYLPKKVALS